MGRTVKSQWEFGDLFESTGARSREGATPPERRVLSVAELTSQVKRLLEQQIGRVWVVGEVSNLRVQSSGHAYFTLKDGTAQLSCVLFRSAATPHRDALADGLRLVVQGELTVYEPRGQYQLVVRQLELQGVGALQLAFERLKAKLQAEGLFDPNRKRVLPPYPQQIGLVTSPTGAAIRDVLHVVRRRNPALRILLAPCRVQGDGAAAEIAAAIGLLNRWARPDVADRRLDLILVTRGGGSLEDLWAFNEEIVARAMVASEVPIVSAIGHEIDFTISDFVADLRAATPSAAAELLTAGVVASREFLAEIPVRLRRITVRRFERDCESVKEARRRLARAHPRLRLNERLQRLDDLRSTLLRVARLAVADRLQSWTGIWQRWRAFPAGERLQRRRERIDGWQRRLVVGGRQRLTGLKNHVEQALSALRLLSPQNVLERGYSITTDEVTGRVLRSVDDTAPGRRLRTRLVDGEVHSVVEAKAPRDGTK